MSWFRMSSSMPMNISKVDVRTKIVREPPVSATSLTFINRDAEEDDEVGPEPVQEPPTSSETLIRTAKRYEIIRAIRILITGDLSVTIAQLNLIYDWELDNRFVQKLFHENDGVETIINLLEVQDTRCHIGALRIIEKISSNNKMRILFANLGVMPLLVAHLARGETDVQILVANALSQLCQVHKCARYFRKEGGIPLLIDCIDVDETTLNTKFELLTDSHKNKIIRATSATASLKELAKYPRSVDIMYTSGLVLCLKKLTNCCHKQLLTEIFELLAHCVKRDDIREAIESDCILATLLQGLTDPDEKLRAACAFSVAECSADSRLICHVVRLLNGLGAIVQLTKDTTQENHTLAVAVLATAKLAQDNRNLKIMSDRGLVHNLLKYVKEDIGDEEVISNALEGLAECGRLEENRQAVANAGIIPGIVKKLWIGEPRVLTAASMCLGTCARSKNVAQMITDVEGMRLLFSILPRKTPSVPATALWALRPLTANTADSAEEIRCTEGALRRLISLLQSEDTHVRAQACGLIAEVCKDEENLQILSEGGLVRALSECAIVKNEEFSLNHAEAIIYASSSRKNAKEFGMRGMVPVMRNHLVTKHVTLHLYAMQALAQLTKDPFNCIVLHECGGIDPIIHDVTAPYEELQWSATRVLRNLQRVALDAEKKALSECRLLYFRKLRNIPKRKDVMEVSAFHKNNKQFYSKLAEKLTSKGTGFNPILESATAAW